MIYSGLLKESFSRSIEHKESTVSIENIEYKMYFVESLGMIIENSYFIDKSINEYISEGFGSDMIKNVIGKVDPKKTFSVILEKFREILEKLWNNFRSLLTNLFGQDKVIKRYRKELENINTPVTFLKDRFIYTNLGVSTSLTTFKSELEKEYSNLIRNISVFRNYASITKIYDAISNIKDNTDNTDAYYDEVRGNIVGSRDTVTADKFGSALFNFFRNGGQTIDIQTITPNEVKVCCNRYFNNANDIKLINREKDQLVKASTEIQKDLTGIDLSRYVDVDLTDETIRMFKTVVQLRASRVNKLCNLYLQVFSAKLDAVKESYIQDKNILYTAVQQMLKEGRI